MFCRTRFFGVEMKMKMKKISVIVPVYNAQAYLHRCIDSICRQTYSNLEIILVNDGSTDNSLEICKARAAEDARIRIVDKTNGGLSDARNHGLRAATGEYVGCVDSDDYIQEQMYETLMQLIMQYETKIASGVDVHLYEDAPQTDFKAPEPAQELLTKQELVRRFLYHKAVPSEGVCNKLFHRSLFEGNEFPVGFTNEDVLVISEIYRRVECMPVSYDARYYYCHRSDSITTGAFSVRTFDRVEMARRVNENLKELDFPFVNNGIRFNELYAQRGVVYKMFVSKIKDDRYRAELKKYRKMFLKCPWDRNVSWFVKGKFFVMFLSPDLYFRCLNNWK